MSVCAPQQRADAATDLRRKAQRVALRLRHARAPRSKAMRRCDMLRVTRSCTESHVVVRPPPTSAKPGADPGPVFSHQKSHPGMTRSLLTATVAVWIALTTPCTAAADLVFSVTEGITYYQTNKEIAARFQPLTELLARAIKRPVR